MNEAIERSRNLFEYTWAECEEIFRTAGGIVITAGSVEQHGLHLPLGTDTILAEAVTEEVCRRTGMYYYPCTTFGQVWSARDFPGTISIPQPLLEDYLLQTVRSVRRFTEKPVFLYSFHKGNSGALKNVVRSLFDSDGWTNVYVLDDPSVEKEAKALLTTPVWNGVWHAGELETALMLHIAPQLVQMDKATREFPETPWDYRLRSVPWKEFLRSGAFGDAAAATAELGARLFEIWVSKLSDVVSTVLSKQ